jgi:hypothetical protein
MDNVTMILKFKKIFCEKVILNSNLLIFLLIIYPVLLIWQGLDFTDLGYALTNAQQIFNDPSSVQYGISEWLTNILGGVWLHFFGEAFGLIGFRFASVLIVYATIFFAFLILIPCFKKEYILIGLFFAELFNASTYWIEYNILTALFYVIAAYFLIKGLQEHKDSLILLSGFFLGLNIFNRISNVLGISLLLCIFAQGYWNTLSVKESIKSALFLISGFIIAVLIISGIMVYLGQFELYVNSILDLFFNYGSNPASPYSLTGLLFLFIKDHFLAFSLILMSIIGFILILKVYSWLTSRSSFVSTIFLLGLFLIGLVITIVIPGERYVIMVMYGLFCLILLKNIIWHSPDKKQLPLLSLMVLLLLVITPLGSSNGISNAIYGMWLAIPIGLIFLLDCSGLDLEIDLNSKNPRLQKFRIELSKIETKKVTCLILISFLSFSLISAYQYTYRDSADRFKMVFTVNHPSLKYVFTTEERAHVVQGLVDELPLYIKKDDYVLAYESIPMVYYLTGSKPYLDNSWPDLYIPDQFCDKLNQSLKEKGMLPVIVRTKFNTRSFTWPDNTKPTEDESYRIRRDIMERFIAAHHYTLAWNNEFFEILTPERQYSVKN